MLQHYARSLAAAPVSLTLRPICGACADAAVPRQRLGPVEHSSPLFSGRAVTTASHLWQPHVRALQCQVAVQADTCGLAAAGGLAWSAQPWHWPCPRSAPRSFCRRLQAAQHTALRSSSMQHAPQKTQDCSAESGRHWCIEYCRITDRVTDATQVGLRHASQSLRYIQHTDRCPIFRDWATPDASIARLCAPSAILETSLLMHVYAPAAQAEHPGRTDAPV